MVVQFLRVGNCLGCSLAFLAAATFAGCGGERITLLPVSGVVTLDGAPLSLAHVEFLPIVDGVESARPASALTNELGRYELQYTTALAGARPGNYRVRISTYQAPVLAERGEVLPALPERVPENYNSRTELVAEVRAERTEFDFHLNSAVGRIRQPDSDH